MVLTPYSSRPIYGNFTAHILLTYWYGHKPTNPRFPHSYNNAASSCLGIAQAAASEGHSRALRASTDRLPVDWRRPRGRPRHGFEQSRAFSNHSTLDFTLHCGEQRIVLPDDASWKRLCSSSVPPDDDDDDETAVGDIHQPFFYRYNTFENLTALMSMLPSGVGARF